VGVHLPVPTDAFHADQKSELDTGRTAPGPAPPGPTRYASGSTRDAEMVGLVQRGADAGCEQRAQAVSAVARHERCQGECRSATQSEQPVHVPFWCLIKTSVRADVVISGAADDLEVFVGKTRRGNCGPVWPCSRFDWRRVCCGPWTGNGHGRNERVGADTVKRYVAKCMDRPAAV